MLNGKLHGHAYFRSNSSTKLSFVDRTWIIIQVICPPNTALRFRSMAVPFVKVTSLVPYLSNGFRDGLNHDM